MMKKIIVLVVVLLSGCAAISFSTKDGYGKRGISGYAIYPDIGGVVTTLWDRVTKEEK